MVYAHKGPKPVHLSAGNRCLWGAVQRRRTVRERDLYELARVRCARGDRQIERLDRLSRCMRLPHPDRGWIYVEASSQLATQRRIHTKPRPTSVGMRARPASIEGAAGSRRRHRAFSDAPCFMRIKTPEGTDARRLLLGFFALHGARMPPPWVPLGRASPTAHPISEP